MRIPAQYKELFHEYYCKLIIPFVFSFVDEVLFKEHLDKTLELSKRKKNTRNGLQKGKP